MPWSYDLWIFQLLGLVLTGAGVIIAGMAIVRRRHAASTEPGAVGIPGNLPEAVGINMARIRVGGDAGGLVVVVGLILAFMPAWWQWFAVIAAGSVFVAGALFLWHRYHPW